MARSGKVPLLALAGLVFVAPNLAAAECLNVTMCLRWQTFFKDHGHGNLPTPIHVPASGAVVTLFRQAPEEPLSGILDQQGCMNFQTAFADGHKLVVKAEAFVGDPLVHVFTSRVRNKPAMGDSPVTDPPAFWLVDIDGLDDGDVIFRNIIAKDDDPFPPMLAAVTQVLQRFTHFAVIPEVFPTDDGKPVLFARYLDYMGNGRSGGTFIFIGPDSYLDKFLIAHEMGHWLQRAWSGYVGDSSGNYSFPSEAACQFTVPPPVDYNNQPILETDAFYHGLRSSEYGTDAMIEGFAHFIAAAVFNDIGEADTTTDEDGIFRYYKEITPGSGYDLFVQRGSRVSLLGGEVEEEDVNGTLGGENKWFENRCTMDAMATIDPDGMGPEPSFREASTELDWLRFFWRFMTKSGSTPPTMLKLMTFLQWTAANAIAHPIGLSDTYLGLLGAMSDPNSGMSEDDVTRFEDANVEMSVHASP